MEHQKVRSYFNQILKPGPFSNSSELFVEVTIYLSEFHKYQKKIKCAIYQYKKYDNDSLSIRSSRATEINTLDARSGLKSWTPKLRAITLAYNLVTHMVDIGHLFWKYGWRPRNQRGRSESSSSWMCPPISKSRNSSWNRVYFQR